MISKWASDYWNMDTARGFHLIMSEKRKRAVFVFSLQIRWIRKIKDVLSWQLRKKKRENNLTRLNKTHRRKGELQTESKPADDEGEMQTHLLRLCLSACMPVCLSPYLTVCQSVYLSLYMFYKVASLLHQCCCSNCGQFLLSCCKLALSCHVVIKKLFLIELLHITQQTPQFPYLYCALHNKVKISLNSTLTLDQMEQL